MRRSPWVALEATTDRSELARGLIKAHRRAMAAARRTQTSARWSATSGPAPRQPGSTHRFAQPRFASLTRKRATGWRAACWRSHPPCFGGCARIYRARTSRSRCSATRGDDPLDRGRPACARPRPRDPPGARRRMVRKSGRDERDGNRARARPPGSDLLGRALRRAGPRVDLRSRTVHDPDTGEKIGVIDLSGGIDRPPPQPGPDLDRGADDRDACP